MARTVMLPTGADGKIRFAKSIPLQIMADEPQKDPNPYSFAGITIQVFNTGGNAGADNTFMIVQGSQGQAHQIPWYQGKKWLETIGIVIDDTSFHTPTENGSSIFVRADDLKASNPDQWTEAFKNFDNPASQWFWGKTSAGNGLGVIPVDEKTVSSTYNYGLIGKQQYLDTVINGILSNGRESILAAATELAKKEGKEVNRDYINRAAFGMIPFYTDSNNTSTLEIPLLMKNPKITTALNTWFPDIKGSSSLYVNPATGQPIVDQTGMSGGPNAGREWIQGIQDFWNNFGKPSPQGPSGKAPGANPLDAIGNAISGGLGFLGEAFKNKPTMVQKLPVIAAKPAATPAAPTVKVSSYTTGYAKPTATPLSPYSLKTTTPSKPPTTVAKVAPTNPTYTRGIS